MRVALDATPLTLSSGGLRRYTSELSMALAAEFSEDEFLLAADRAFPMPPSALPNLTAAPGAANAIERRWWSWGLNRMLGRERIDVYHGTSFEVPYRSLLPTVMTLHDLSPWKGYPCSRRVRLRTPLLLRLGRPTLGYKPTRAGGRGGIPQHGVAS